MKAKTGILAALTILGAFVLWVAVGYWTAAEVVYPVENGTGRFVRYVLNPIRESLARPHLVLENRRLADEVALLKMRLGDQAAPAAYRVYQRCQEDQRQHDQVCFPSQFYGHCHLPH